MHNKKTIIITSIILCLVVLGLATSYALFTFNVTKDTTFKLGVGNLELSITDNETKDVFIMENVYPVKDEVGLNQEGYTFTVTNTGNLKSAYKVYLDQSILENETYERLSEEYVKISITNNKTNKTKTGLLTEFEDYNIEQGILDKNESVSYTLKMWIDYNSGNEAQNKYFAVKVRIDGIQYNEAAKLAKLGEKVLIDNQVIEKEVTLTNSSNNTKDLDGLYKSNLTNTGEDTYYFRGNVNNNYVEFAGFTWRIVRINEDGTIRLILQDTIDDNTLYRFNESPNNYTYMYYTNGNIKNTVENWYKSNLKKYSNYIATGDYFCEQAKVKYDSSYAAENEDMAIYTDYNPNFRCQADGNGKGLVNSNIGLITYDEIVYAGGYIGKTNNNYLKNGNNYWLMSPCGFRDGYSGAWYFTDTGYIHRSNVRNILAVRPVINLNSNVKVKGIGTLGDPYVVYEDIPVITCDYDIGKTWDFAYTGNEQEFEVPCDGTYKLETWGAQGGNTKFNSYSNVGGYGGYSYGSTNLIKDSILYINNGGLGIGITQISSNGTFTSTMPGYNGGSYASYPPNNSSHAGGGGATHIATQSGLLSTLSNNINNILIVSGGGGGASSHITDGVRYSGDGGSAGGYIGNNSGNTTSKCTYCYFWAQGGTQTSGGTPIHISGNPPYNETQSTGSFGKGGNVYTSNTVNDLAYFSGGGAGFYGGSAAAHNSAAGGSGYIGNSLLTDKAMYCYNCATSNDVSTKTVSTTCHSSTPTENCAKEGNGYARITLVSLD